MKNENGRIIVYGGTGYYGRKAMPFLHPLKLNLARMPSIAVCLKVRLLQSNQTIDTLWRKLIHFKCTNQF